MARPEYDVPSCVLVNRRACSCSRPNVTTAWSWTSTGLPIGVTFCTAPPPALSHFSVFCPGIKQTGSWMSPIFVSEDADLAVLRVPRDIRSRSENLYSDYFVYKVNHQCPKLDLLPNPFPEALEDDEIAILSCGDDKYVVAALQLVLDLRKPTFKLHMYRSTDGKKGSWSSQILYVEEPLRDKVCPVPDEAERHIYHRTAKVIVLGDDEGTVGWVDLWRGIILCDVLSERPRLHDLPLPLPSKCNLDYFLNCCPTYFRDIAVNQRKNTIKYVEMEITPPEEVDPDSECYQVKGHTIVPGSWTATTWKMPIPVSSWRDWRPDCSISLANLSLDDGNQMLYKILHRLLGSPGYEKLEATGGTLPLGCLSMAFPTLTVVDDGVLYFLSKSICMGNIEAVVAIDTRKNVLQGVRVIDSNRCFLPDFSASGLSSNLNTNTSGTRASLGQAERSIWQRPVISVEGVERYRDNLSTSDTNILPLTEILSGNLFAGLLE